MRPGRSIWRSRVAFREVRVHEVREVLRHWLSNELGPVGVGKTHLATALGHIGAEEPHGAVPTAELRDMVEVTAAYGFDQVLVDEVEFTLDQSCSYSTWLRERVLAR